MKSRFSLSLLFSALLITSTVLVGCKDENAAEPTATLSIRFNPFFGSGSSAPKFALNTPYINAAGDTVRFTTAKFYVSEISLVDTLGKLVPVTGAPVYLIDWASPQRADGTSAVALTVKPGVYAGVVFSIGVPESLNHQNASTQAAPLGVDSGMWWAWNPGYIFHKIEGNFDSLKVSRNFLYHVGRNSLRLSVMLGSLSGTSVTRFTINENATFEYNVRMDYSTVFRIGMTAGQPIRLKAATNERVAHGGNLLDRIYLNMTTMYTRM
jgi:hypothetical protein